MFEDWGPSSSMELVFLAFFVSLTITKQNL